MRIDVWAGVPLSSIKYLVLQIKYQIHYSWVGFEGMTCSGATHKFQYSSTTLECLPSLSNMKSRHVEGADIIVFKLTYMSCPKGSTRVPIF